MLSSNLSHPKVHSSISKHSFEEELDQVFMTRQKQALFKAIPKEKKMILKREYDKVV